MTAAMAFDAHHGAGHLPLHTLGAFTEVGRGRRTITPDDPLAALLPPGWLDGPDGPDDPASVHLAVQRTADDPLATRGERIASAGFATVFEGGGGLLGGVVGGALGAWGGPAGIMAGASVVGHAGSRGGGKLRDVAFVQGAEESLADLIDRMAGTTREPDRYDDLLEAP